MKKLLLSGKRFFFIIFALLVGVSLYAQQGFKTTFYQNDVASSLAYVCAEFNDMYIFGGAYFHDTIGRWTGFYAGADTAGQTWLLASERVDTIYGFSVENKMVHDDEAFYMLGNNSLLSYDPIKDEIKIKARFDLKKDSFYCHGLNIDNEKNFIFSFGTILSNTQDSDIGIIKYRDSVLLSYYDIDPSVKSHCGRPLIRADGNIYLTCADLSAESKEYDKRYIICLDSDLNKKFSTKNTSNEIRLAHAYGSYLDKSGNILFTGKDRIHDGTAINLEPRVVKTDSLGKLIWNKKVSLPQKYNYEGWGRWQNIVESKDNDGYILVGSHFTGSRQFDTSRCDALMCKISYDGETIWSKKYTYREGNNRIYSAFYDVIDTKDGGYFAVGGSMNNSAPSNEILDPPGFRAIILKTDSFGNITPDSTSSNSEINSEDSKLKIYPNPCSEQCYFTQTSSRPLHIKIFSSAGDLMDDFVCEDSNHVIVMNTEKYKGGFYYAYVYQDNKFLGIYPFIKT
jgi:hypothetical protein